jgi:hypothetical protein
VVSSAVFLTSSSFAVDVVENWQSEYLHFFLYVFGTVFSLPCGGRARPRSTYPMAGPTCSADQRDRAAARRVRESTTSRHTYGS